MLFKHEGHQTLHQERKGNHGDLEIIIKIKSSSWLKRDGNDVESTHLLTLSEALYGTNLKVKTIDRIQDFEVKEKALFDVSYGLELSKEFEQCGVPVEKSSNTGAHIAKVGLKIPTDLTPEMKKLIM